jgi:hypothetical protein
VFLLYYIKVGSGKIYETGDHWSGKIYETGDH